MPLDLPPIPGKKPSTVVVNEDGEEEFDFEAIPFKADYMYTDPSEVKELLKSGKKVLGTPAASLTWGIDGNRMIPALEAGKEGEKLTASLLDKLAEEYKDLYVFHSLSWPESAGDTDHVLVYGDYILIIDSKRWKASRKYSVTAGGSILRGTVPFPSGKVHIASAIGIWRRKLKGLKIQGVVTIAQEKVFVSRDKNWYKAPFRLVENEKLEDFLRETFTKNPPKSRPNGKMLTELGLLLVKARDRRSDLIRIGGERREND
jgi:hypothetical protein